MNKKGFKRCESCLKLCALFWLLFIYTDKYLSNMKLKNKKPPKHLIFLLSSCPFLSSLLGLSNKYLLFLCNTLSVLWHGIQGQQVVIIVTILTGGIFVWKMIPREPSVPLDYFNTPATLLRYEWKMSEVHLLEARTKNAKDVMIVPFLLLLVSSFCYQTFPQ